MSAMELTKELVEQTLMSFFQRCELIKLAGGIALKDVVNGTAVVPEGWVMDEQTYYYIPADMMFCDTPQ